MRFDSAEFLFFALAVLTLHRLLPARRAMLVLASYLFYASWNPPFLLLLLASTALDYTAGRRIEDAPDDRRRRAWLGLSLAGNLGVLVWFKYVNFALDNLALLGAPPGLLEPLRVHADVPLGISFYTFQTMSYTLDVYRGKAAACRRPGDFALFVAFFPQLLAGPIVRAGELLPQIRRDPVADREQALTGVELCLVGLFKKVALADNAAVLVDRCFADPGAFSGGALVLGSLFFLVQIYCDFSGYSTMARGLARLLGYHLPRNFFYPLLSASPIDYRRGWHITMGTWFRDYLYYPLGGGRGGLWRTSRNTLITWMAFGLWHGPSWTFVAWGGLNGLLLVAWRLARAWGWLPEPSRASRAVGLALMLTFLTASVVFFRSQSLADAGLIFTRIASFSPGEAAHASWAVGLAVLYGAHWASRLWYREGLLARVGWPARLALIAAALGALALFAGSGEAFYYFQF